MLSFCFLASQEMEEIVKEKEKELENIEEKGCALIHKKNEEVCSVVMDTLQGLNHSWANLDHLVSLPLSTASSKMSCFAVDRRYFSIPRSGN